MTEQLVKLPDLAPNIIRILGQNPGKFTLQGTNTYLIGTGKTRLLIDTGEGIESYESLLSSVLNSENCTVGSVLLTHWHYDHVGGVSQIARLCPNATYSKAYPLERGPTEFLPIHEGDVFTVEGGRVRAVYTPGHTTDHTAFWMEDVGALFTGDSVLGQGTAVFENLTTYMASLKKQLELFPKILYPSHGPEIQGDQAALKKIQEYIDHRQQRENEVIEVLKGAKPDAGLSPLDIVKVIYAKYPKDLWSAAERGVVLHLEKLRDEGKAERIGDGKWRLTDTSRI